MVTSSSRRSSGPVLRSLSPSGRFHSPLSNESLYATTSAFVASTSSGFSSPSSAFFGHRHDDHHHHHHHHHRSASPTRVNLYSSGPPAPSFSFSINRSTSPGRSMAVPQHNHRHSIQKKSCMCSPTTHPGSFRCSLHKNNNSHRNGSGSYPSNRLNMQRSAMTNSLVRIGGVEGEWVKRALTALIRPSSHQQRRRGAFQPGPSRLSVMSKADDI